MSHDKAHGAPEAEEPQSQAPADEQQAVDEAPAGAPGHAPIIEPPPDLGAAEAYHQRARLAEDRLAEVLTAYRKLRIDNEAHRDRTAKNIERRFDQRRERLLLKFIEILDNLDRALEAAETTYAGVPLIEGLILVRTQLLQTLQEEGLERIAVLGMPFDPSVAEAVETRPVDDPDHHHVVMKELMRGYRLNGRVARPVRVAIGEYRGAPQPTGEPEGAPLAGLTVASQPEPAQSDDTNDTPPPERQNDVASGDSEPSLEEIVARAEAQEALFPDAFEEPAADKDKA